jgi:hypothetical protein
MALVSATTVALACRLAPEWRIAMLASRAVRRRVAFVPLALTLGVFFAACQRGPSDRERAAAEARAAAERALRERPVQAPIPVDPPLEKTRVPDAGLPCDVDDVLARKCRRCHTNPPRHNAPFELYTWNDTQQDRIGKPLYVHIGRVVDTGYMPLALPTNPPVERLTPEEKKVLLDWVDAGAPKSDCDPNAAQTPRPDSSSRKPSRRAARAPAPSASAP